MFTSCTYFLREIDRRMADKKELAKRQGTVDFFLACVV